MIGFNGFNVGVKISLGDMETALDYINDTDIYKNDIEELKRQRVNKSESIAEAFETRSDNVSIGTATISLEDAIEDDIINDEEFEDTDDDLIFDEDEEDEGMDFGDDGFEFEDEDDEMYLEEDEDDFDFGDEDGDEDDFDFGDEEEGEVIIETPKVITKSDRELELERQLTELKRAEEERLQREKIEREREERERQQEELARQRERERKLEIELERVKRERDDALRRSREITERKGKVQNEKTIRQSNKSNSSVRDNRSSNNAINTSPRNDTLKKQAERLVKSENKSVEYYSSLEIEALWVEVRKFMVSNGVASKLISKSLVEQKFGAQNIKKLYLKGYLIPFGSKLTIGK